MKNKLIENPGIPFLAFIILISFLHVPSPSPAQKHFTWAKSINGSGLDYSQSISVTSDGKIYIGGSFEGSNVDFDPGAGIKNLSSNGKADIYFACFDTSGNFKNAVSIGGIENDKLNSLAIDNQGNIYITGYYKSATIDLDLSGGTYNITNNGGLDIFIAKYDSAFNFKWGYGFGGTGYDEGLNVNVDNNSNLYFAGVFSNSINDFDPGTGTRKITSNGDFDIVIAKFNTDGVLRWVNTIGGTGQDYGNFILPDNNGNFCLTGMFAGNVDFNPGSGTNSNTDNGMGDYFIAKYDTDCNYKWVSNAGGKYRDEGKSLSYDSKGNIYTVGFYYATDVDFDPGPASKIISTLGFEDGFMVKYNSEGNVMWVNSYAGKDDEVPRQIVIDNKDRIFISGYYVSLKMDADPGADSFMLYNHNGTGIYDLFLIESDTAGKTKWAFGLGGRHNEQALGIAVDQNGAFYLTGMYSSMKMDFDPSADSFYLYTSSTANVDIFIAKYSDSVSASVLPEVHKDKIILFSNGDKIYVNIKSEKQIENRVFIYDISGHKIIDRVIGNNELKVFSLPGRKSAGIYLVRIISADNETMITRKLFVY